MEDREQKQFDALKAELKTYFEKAAVEQKATGTMTEGLKNQIEALQKQADALDVKLAERHAAAQPAEDVTDFLKNHDGLKRIARDHSGNCVIQFSAKHAAQIERKTTISDAAVGFMATGVLPIDRAPGITTEARQVLLLRDALTTRPTTMALVDFVKVNAGPHPASPQTEGNDKGENQTTFTSVSNKVQTLATWIPASKQVLDDMAELMGFLQTSLPYYVNLLEEKEMLAGSGSDPHLSGLITNATAFNSGLLSSAAGWNRLDIIGRALQQISAAQELTPTFLVIHPNDWWSIRLTKDSFGRYILGNPMQDAGVAVTGGTINRSPNLFGLLPIVTTSIASGTFLVGSGDPAACEIRDRMDLVVEIATQHASFFTQNLIAIRAEKRMALITKRPGSFVSGSFTTSPVVAGQ